ncbi:Long-chain-fatty-acid--CoA ligase 5, partial [Hypsibius exemplaris]
MDPDHHSHSHSHSHSSEHADGDCSCCFTQVAVAILCALAAVIWYRYKDYPRLRPLGLDYDHQTVQVENGVRKRKIAKPSESLGFECPRTIYGYMNRGAEINGNGPCLGFRRDATSPYEWITYKQTMDRIKNFGAGLVHLGVKSKSGSESFVGIFARTSPEWVIAEYGTYAYNLVAVPFYDSIGPDACQSAINRLEVKLLICGDSNNLETMLAGKHGLKSVKVVVFVDAPTDAVRAKAKQNGLKVLTFEEVENLGKVHKIPLNLPQPEDLAILMFTSGTTGEPKAAMLTHRAVAVAVANVIIGLLPVRLNTNTTGIAYLPLAHIMERIQEMATFVYGGKQGFNSNGIPLLIEDIKELRPDLVVLVPRILNRIYGKMLEAVRTSKFKQAMLKMAIFFKSLEMKMGIYRRDSIWDRLVFKKLQDTIGGRVRVCATGSAPLDAGMTNVMRAALGCYIYEVYGQTETAGILTGTFGGDCLAGHVGAPAGGADQGGIEIKLIDVPDLGYFAKDGKGEICARGAHLMEGYYGMPEETAKVLDQDGFVHTGDVGQWIEGGRLKVIDRKKHIFKLSQGEYLAPEKLETELLTSPLVNQIFIDGNSLHPFTVALVYPNYDLLQPVQNGGGDVPDKLTAAEVEKTLLAEFKVVGKSRYLKSYEIPKKIYILPEPFSSENGFMTPTQKVKRETVRMAFKKQLTDMYKGVSLVD